MHFLLLGILLGMGAAIPIGPVNLEIIRRHLRFGAAYGITTGLGACSADLVYLILLSLGALTLLQFPIVLRATGFIGALILIWFAIGAFRATATDSTEIKTFPSLLRYGIDGFIMTLINPFTILFWASISSQISIEALSHNQAILLTSMGVMIGTVGWVLFLNFLLYVTRHRLSSVVIKWLNYTGGVILLGFAGVGLMRAIFFKS